MFRRLLLIPLLLALVACQGPQVQRDFDPTRDFSAYRAWSWKEPALQYRPDDPRIQSDLTEQRIREGTFYLGVDRAGALNDHAPVPDLQHRGLLCIGNQRRETEERLTQFSHMLMDKLKFKVITSIHIGTTSIKKNSGCAVQVN